MWQVLLIVLKSLTFNLWEAATEPGVGSSFLFPFPLHFPHLSVLPWLPDTKWALPEFTLNGQSYWQESISLWNSSDCVFWQQLCDRATIFCVSVWLLVVTWILQPLLPVSQAHHPGLDWLTSFIPNMKECLDMDGNWNQHFIAAFAKIQLFPKVDPQVDKDEDASLPFLPSFCVCIEIS